MPLYGINPVFVIQQMLKFIFWNNNFEPLASEGELSEIKKRGLYEPDTIYATILKNRGGRVGVGELLDFNGNTGKISNQIKSSNYKF